MSVLAVIPARGGSKGIARKNIRLLAGRPLLAYTADVARSSRNIQRAILSTEDSEIADVGRALGLDVPFLRPAELAQDDTPTLPVLQHAVRWLEEQGEFYDIVCLLQATTPFRTSEEVDRAIELLQQNDADSVVSVVAVPAEYNPHWVYFRNDDGSIRLATGEAVPIPRRQELPPAFHRDGAVYLVRRDVLVNKNSLFGERVFGFVRNADHNVNIDNEADWMRAEALATQLSGVAR